MALTSSQFLTPVGPLDPALLFPGKSAPDVEALMAGYIARANTAVAKLTDVPAEQRDGLAYLFVLYLVYDGVVDRMANTPSSFSAADEGSIGFSSAQLVAMQKKRDAALDAYTDAVALITAVPTADQQASSTLYRPVRF